MENDQQAGRVQWSSPQAYAFAAVCLVVGFVVGYLLHSQPEGADALASKQQVMQEEAQPNPHEMPTPEQMKHMGDKVAEPLLTQLKKDQNNPEVLAKLGSVYFRTGQYALATEFYEKAVKIKPSAEGYVSLSNSYHYDGADDKAIAALNQALRVDPKSPNALFNLGMLNWQVKKDPKAAIEMWQKLLVSNPKHPHRAQVEKLIAKAKQSMERPSQAEVGVTP